MKKADDRNKKERTKENPKKLKKKEKPEKKMIFIDLRLIRKHLI